MTVSELRRKLFEVEDQDKELAPEHIIGQLMQYEKYTFVNGALMASIVRDVLEVLGKE